MHTVLLGFLALAQIASPALAQEVSIRPAAELNVLSRTPESGDFLGLGFGSVWMSNGNLIRADAASGEVLARIPVGPGPYRGVGIGEGFVWVPAAGNQTLYKMDPATNSVVGQVQLAFSGTESSVGVGAGAVWIVTHETDERDVLSRVNVASLAVQAKIDVPNGCAGVVFGFGSVWVAVRSQNKVVRIDPATNAIVSEISTGPGPNFITAGEGAVWTLNQGDGHVTRINPDGTTVDIDARLPGGGGDISAGEGGVYMTMPGFPVVKIDPVANHLSVIYSGYGFGDALRVGYGAVWVSGAAIHRIALPN